MINKKIVVNSHLFELCSLNNLTSITAKLIMKPYNFKNVKLFVDITLSIYHLVVLSL